MVSKQQVKSLKGSSGNSLHNQQILMIHLGGIVQNFAHY